MAANGVTGVEPVGDVLDDDWGGLGASTVDVVLAGDVFYDLRMADRVRPWLFTAWVRGAVVMVGDPGRSQLPEGLREWGWAVQLAGLRSRSSWGIGELADLRTAHEGFFPALMGADAALA